MTLGEMGALFGQASVLLLSGVDQGEIPAGAFASWDDASNCIVFVINGVGYCVAEDPGDGYRSSMRDDIGVLPAALVRNRFAPVRVTTRPRHNAEFGGTSEGLDFLDALTGCVVLSVGTDNTDDYYPSFVASWFPQHLSVNSRRRGVRASRQVARGIAGRTSRHVV